MKFLTLLAALIALTAFTARADDGTQQTPPPAPTQPSDQGDAGQQKTAARKEEEDEAAIRASKLSKMAAVFKSKAGLADNIAALTARAEKAEADLAAALKQVESLTKENARLKEDWAALEEAAASLGDGKDDKQQTSPEHQKAANVINQQVAKELRGIGHTPKEKKDSGTQHQPAANQKLTPLQMIALGRSQQKPALN
jgi:chromosome segregation ATPase